MYTLESDLLHLCVLGNSFNDFCCYGTVMPFWISRLPEITLILPQSLKPPRAQKQYDMLAVINQPCEILYSTETVQGFLKSGL